MTKLFSVARRDDPSQPRPAVYAGRAEHIAALVARKPAPAPEHIAADPTPSPSPSPSPAAPEPWWREMRRQRTAEVFGMAARSEFPDRLPLESIIALASLTLDGVCAPQDLAAIRKRVDSLLTAGLLQSGDDHLFGHEAVRAVLPTLALPEGAALVAWLGAEAPAKRRGSGAEARAVNQAIQAATLRLEKGCIDWREVPRAAFAAWLCRVGGPLDGHNVETVLRAYLNEKGLANAACPKGRQGAGVRAEAFVALDTAWARAESDRQRSHAPPRLAAGQ